LALTSHSQNFTVNTKLVEELIIDSGINKEDTVIDLGAGKGALTKVLQIYAKNVLAVEKDKKLIEILKKEFLESKNVRIVKSDLLDFQYPDYPFKVFSNIPFSMTSRILKKLIKNKFAIDNFIFIQYEAGLKYLGFPEGKETLISLFLKINHDIEIFHRFGRYDFEPTPSVKIFLLRIKRTKNKVENIHVFKDFISFVFSNSNPDLSFCMKKIFNKDQLWHIYKIFDFRKHKKPSDLTFEQYLELFEIFNKYTSDKQKILIDGWSEKIEDEGKKIEKYYRTRKDPTWLEK